MRDADAIETINREQLVTATDRLLLAGGRLLARRRGTPPAPRSRGSIPSLALAAQVRSSISVAPPAPRGRGSIPSLAAALALAPVVRGSHPHVIHRPLAVGSQLIPIARPTAPAAPALRPLAFDARAQRDERTVPGHRRVAVFPPLFSIGGAMRR